MKILAKKILSKLIRLVIVFILACVAYILVYAVVVGAIEAVKAVVPAALSLVDFIKLSDPLVIGLIIVCFVVASLVYEPISKKVNEAIAVVRATIASKTTKKENKDNKLK